MGTTKFCVVLDPVHDSEGIDRTKEDEGDPDTHVEGLSVVGDFARLLCG